MFGGIGILMKRSGLNLLNNHWVFHRVRTEGD